MYIKNDFPVPAQVHVTFAILSICTFFLFILLLRFPSSFDTNKPPLKIKIKIFFISVFGIFCIGRIHNFQFFVLPGNQLFSLVNYESGLISSITLCKSSISVSFLKRLSLWSLWLFCLPWQTMVFLLWIKLAALDG